jgi:hypothetical protein
MSSIITLNEHFLIQSLSEKNKELQTLNSLLFNKIASLKIKINQLEYEFENKQKDNNGDILEFDGFEIIDIINI